MRGLFIALEGGEFVGKSTQSQLLQGRIEREYPEYSVVLTAEPSELIRELVTQSDILDLTRLYLITAGRTETYQRVVRPQLDAGQIVITDRYLMSTLVYQNRYYRAGFDAHYYATDDTYPDLNIVLDMPTKVARRRKGQDLDVLEDVPVEEWGRRREAFLEWSNRMKTASVVDALGTQEEVHDRIWEYVKPVIQRKIAIKELVHGE